jgi:hypothetical protein
VRRVSIIAIAIVVGTAACGLDVTGALDPASSTSGLDGGRDSTPPTDDAGGVDEAGLDAGRDGAATPLAFCAAQTDPAVSHCWDFETTTTSIGAFDPQVTDGTSAVLAAGGSQALSITLPSGASSRAAWVRKAIGAFGPGATTYEIRFRFAIPAASLDYAGLGGFSDGMGSIFGVASYGQAAAMQLSVTVPNGSATPVPASPGSAWHSAVVEVVQGMVRPTAKVTIDATLVFDGFWDVGPSPTLDLRLGAFYTAGNTGAYQVLFDDVLVRHH